MKKTNNKGFSMTEVIVAVAIFLILAIPILSQLVLSVKNNSKAKASQYGVNVAESEMELMKSVDLNAIAKIYEKSEETGADGTAYTKYSLPTSYYEGTIGNTDFKLKETEFMSSPYATVSLMEFARKVPSFKQDASGKCTFTYNTTITNADTASAEDETSKEFTVEVTLDPSQYDGVDDGEGIDVAGDGDGNDELGYNTPKDGAVQNLSKEDQAIIGTNMGAYEREVREKFWTDVTLNSPPGYRFTAQDAYLLSSKNIVPSRFLLNTFDLHRTVKITVEENPDGAASTAGKYKVTTNYIYDASMKIGLYYRFEKSYTSFNEVDYFNTVPDVKFYYNQLVIGGMTPMPQDQDKCTDRAFSDTVIFTNKLPYEQKHAEGTGNKGYQYYYTNSDLYFITDVDNSRGYYALPTCNVSLGPDYHASQLEDGRKLNLYYTITTGDPAKTILNNLDYDTSEINVADSSKKVVAQEFQPIYDIKLKVSPTNGNGITTKLEGTRGQ